MASHRFEFNGNLRQLKHHGFNWNRRRTLQNPISRSSRHASCQIGGQRPSGRISLRTQWIRIKIPLVTVGATGFKKHRVPLTGFRCFWNDQNLRQGVNRDVRRFRLRATAVGDFELNGVRAWLIK